MEGPGVGHDGPRFATAGDSSEPELGIFRVWSSAQGQGPFTERDLDLDQLTDAAREALGGYDRLTDNLAAGECAPKGMPAVIGNPYPREFIDQSDTILMRLEEDDTVRIIHMAPPAPGQDRPFIAAWIFCWAMG